MKHLKDILFVLTWVFGFFFGVSFWIAVGTFIALAVTKPLIIAVETVVCVLVLSFVLFILSAILTYFLN